MLEFRPTGADKAIQETVQFYKKAFIEVIDKYIDKER